MRKGYIGTITLTVDPSQLSHCRECCQPMYCIYDNKVRWQCWDCEQIAKIAKREERRAKKAAGRRKTRAAGHGSHRQDNQKA